MIHYEPRTRAVARHVLRQTQLARHVLRQNNYLNFRGPQSEIFFSAKFCRCQWPPVIPVILLLPGGALGALRALRSGPPIIALFGGTRARVPKDAIDESRDDWSLLIIKRL